MTAELPKLSWEQRIGDIGETEVKARLQRFATATKVERDVGIDFVCELLKDGRPVLPFSVQAKGTEHFDEQWRTTIKKTTVRYWLAQLTPVFIIVYDDQYQKCFWMSVEELRYTLVEKLSTNAQSESISFTMGRERPLEKADDPEPFISAVHRGHESIQLARGYPHGKGMGYVQGLPDPPRTPYEEKRIQYVIRNGMYSLVQNYLYTGDIDRAEATAKACTIFDDTHYTQFLILGDINEQNGNLEGAVNNYRRAAQILRDDPKWPSESKQEILEGIDALIQRCGERDGEDNDDMS